MPSPPPQRFGSFLSRLRRASSRTRGRIHDWSQSPEADRLRATADRAAHTSLASIQRAEARFRVLFSNDRYVDAFAAAILLLALCLAGISADSYLDRAFRVLTATSLSRWSSWWPLMLALAAIALLTEGFSDRRRGNALLLVLLGGFLWAGVRLAVAWRGPLFYVAVPEAIRIVSFVAIALGLWLLAIRRFPLAALVWVAALAIIAISRAGIAGGPLLWRPDWIPVFVSVLFGIPMLLGLYRAGAYSGALPSSIAPNRSSAGGTVSGRTFGRAFGRQAGRFAGTVRPRPAVALFFQVVGILLGLGLAVFIAGLFARAGSGAARSTAEFTQTAERLWSQSLLFGWGREGWVRLALKSIAPMDLPSPGWIGWRGNLAMFGLVALVFAPFVSARLLLRTYRATLPPLRSTAGGAFDAFASPAESSESLPSDAPSATSGFTDARAAFLGLTPAVWALCAAQVVWIWLWFGGPNSTVPSLLAVGWIALGWGGTTRAVSADAPAPTPAALRWREFTNSVSAKLAAVILLIAVGASLGPIYAAGLVDDIGHDDLANPDLEPRISRAQAIVPWHPGPFLVRAAWLREQLSRPGAWSEETFQAVVGAYGEAIGRDPYDPTLVLRLLDFLREGGRVEPAIETARQALEINPGAAEIAQWTYNFALNEGRPELAQQMLTYHLRLEPNLPVLWRRRFMAAQAGGETLSAQAALDVALTAVVARGVPEEGELMRAAFTRMALGENTAPTQDPMEAARE